MLPAALALVLVPAADYELHRSAGCACEKHAPGKFIYTVPAGQTVSVFLYPALTDFARADAHGVLRAIPGDYSLAFGVEETLAAGGGFIKVGTVRAV